MFKRSEISFIQTGKQVLHSSEPKHVKVNNRNPSGNVTIGNGWKQPSCVTFAGHFRWVEGRTGYITRYHEGVLGLGAVAGRCHQDPTQSPLSERRARRGRDGCSKQRVNKENDSFEASPGTESMSDVSSSTCQMQRHVIRMEVLG